MKVLVLDTETTGFDPEVCKVVEIAGAVVDPLKRRVIEVFNQLVDPGVLIPADAMGVHHILDRDVSGKMTLDMAISKYVEDLQPYVAAAHNAEFDSSFLPGVRGTGDWICTYRCAKHLYPDCPSFSNQTLRYHLRLFKEPEFKAMPPHRASADVWTTAHILIRMLKEGHDVKKLIELTRTPILLKTVHFGKWRGTPWATTPKDYLQWILRGKDFDRDVVHTARHHLGNK